MKAKDLLGKDKILNILNKLLKSSKADLTTISFYQTASNVTRFANMRIHQNIQQLDCSVCIKVVLDNRVAVAVTNSLRPHELKETLDRACNIAKVSQKEAIEIKSSRPHPINTPETNFADTINFSFQEKSDRIKKLFSRADKFSLDVAGSFFTGIEEMAVVNSVGIQRYQPSTACSLKVIALNGESSGYASALGRSMDAIRFDEVSDKAFSKCSKFKKLDAIKPGRFTCILEPEAVCEVLLWLGYIGFGAKQFCEHTSFMCARLGDKIMSNDLTIYDDGFHPRTLQRPFDFEGTKKQRTMLIENGVARGIVYDNFYGSVYNKPSTGHAAPFSDVGGPTPSNLIMEGGNSSLDNMIKTVRHGLLITRFNYVNGLLDTKNAVMTGLTRDGTFLIKDGKIKKAVKNLRFTQNILEAFSNIKLISNERRLTGDPAACGDTALVPALLIEDFTFTQVAD